MGVSVVFLIKKVCVNWKAKPSHRCASFFPFTFVHTPEGLYTGLSFASTGVLENKNAVYG